MVFGNLKNLIKSKINNTSPNHLQYSHEKNKNITIVSSESKTSQSSLPSSSTSNSLKSTSSELPKYHELSPRYNIIEKIGEGAFSKVFKAIDKDNNITVAIKVIDKTTMSKSQIEGVLKEISIMRRLDHPNVVKLHNFINTPSTTFIVIEYISGGELFNQIVKFTYFSEDLARHIIIQVVKAVDYLHSEVGVVHRDIKPENILFDQIRYIPSSTKPKRRKSDDDSKLDEGEFQSNIGGAGIGAIKLADFGLSKILWDSNTKTPCGTASYTAPEIVKDTAYSKSVDMWAIGCVLYTLLCGFPPFYDTDPKVLTLKVSRGEYTFLSPWWDEISKEAKDLVSHLLTVDPAKRSTPDEVLTHPWILNNSLPTDPAIDSPIYKAKNTSSVLRFEETIPSIELISKSTLNNVKFSPRAEALRFAFDTGINVQRTATPLRRLLEDDDYFDESEDEDESEIDDDTEDDEEDDLNSDDENKTYIYQALYKSPLMKKFPKGQITPNHCERKGKGNESSRFESPITKISTERLTQTAPLNHTVVKPQAVRLSSNRALNLDMLEPKRPQQYQFQEINGFNLNMEANTLLNRRKTSGSVACGPSIK